MEAKNSSMFPNAEKIRIKDFAERVTPPNWNISIDDATLEGRPGILNIRLFFMNRQHEEPLKAGEAHGPMRFYKGAARTELWLYPHGREHNEAGWSWEGTIIHELAHIAVSRLIALKTKRYKENTVVNCAVDLGEDTHGPTFQRALLIMLNRAISAFGKQLREDVIHETLSDLEHYKNFCG